MKNKSIFTALKCKIIFLFILLLTTLGSTGQETILIETESFKEKGGWVLDQQFINIMGSPYLMAHGLGMPVADASTTFFLKEKGNYYLWVRTKDWAPYPKGPGSFSIIINGKKLNQEFGANGINDWAWYQAGPVEISQGENEIRLHDETGFNGRCDAIILTSDKKYKPSNDLISLKKERNLLLGNSLENGEIPSEEFDLVVVGGGIAGIATAVSASRLNLKVALIQDRPVLGGNNSSEVRVHLMGRTDLNHYPKLGRIVRELDNGDPGNAGKPEEYGDERKFEVVNAEKNISLFLNWHAYQVEKNGNTISKVYAQHIETGEIKAFKATFFTDCTGDGTIGYLAGAEYMYGRESKKETNEPLAPEKADSILMGFSNQWYAEKRDTLSSFPLCPWAHQMNEEYHLNMIHGDWYWESGFSKHTILDAEEIRDNNLRAVFGNWAYLKNNKKEKYAPYQLDWVAYIAGKRESRRLVGDYVLTQHDFINNTSYPDAFVTSTWGLDLHLPHPENQKFFPGQEFISTYNHPKKEHYAIPYRCLYSKNISNLFMAGRNISVTHVALGSVRVMRTTGMMGEVVGMAAYLCKKHQTTPRGVYEKHLKEFIQMLTDNIQPCVPVEKK